jgi:membrane protease YdiL (CAAX protease family)
MSEVSQGPGWWLASDGRWYPPDQHPGFIPQPPPASGPHGVPSPLSPTTTPGPTNGLAIASLVLGIVWIWGIGSILALVFGYRAKRQIAGTNGRQGGRGMATAGIVLGWVGIVGAVLVTIILSVSLGSLDSDPHDGVCNQDRYWQDPDCG